MSSVGASALRAPNPFPSSNSGWELRRPHQIFGLDDNAFAAELDGLDAQLSVVLTSGSMDQKGGAISPAVLIRLAEFEQL